VPTILSLPTGSLATLTQSLRRNSVR